MSFVGFGVAAVLGYLILIVVRIRRLNNEPRQIQLAAMFGEAGQRESDAESMAAEISEFVRAQDWSNYEFNKRIPHALGMVKAAAAPDVYGKALGVGQDVIARIRHPRRAVDTGRERSDAD